MRLKLNLILLLFSTLTSAQKLSEEQRKFINDASALIDSDSNFENSKWDLLLEKVKDKRIVSIGEFNHGSKEVFDLRYRLIQKLHKELGFEVILFESGLGELIAPNLQKDHLNSRHITSRLMGPWITREFDLLMQYVKAENLEIAGFDVQRTGKGFEEALSVFLLKNLENTDRFLNLENRYGKAADLLRNRKTTYDNIKGEVSALRSDYNDLYNMLGNGAESSKEAKLIRKTLLNRIAFLDYMLQFKSDGDWNKRWAARDTQMYENINWLLKNIYPGKEGDYRGP